MPIKRRNKLKKLPSKFDCDTSVLYIVVGVSLGKKQITEF